MQDEHPEEFGSSGPQAAGARDRRSQGRGRQRDADHNRRSHERACVHDRREGQRHDQGGLERFRLVKRVGRAGGSGDATTCETWDARSRKDEECDEEEKSFLDLRRQIERALLPVRHKNSLKL